MRGRPSLHQRRAYTQALNAHFGVLAFACFAFTGSNFVTTGWAFQVFLIGLGGIFAALLMLPISIVFRFLCKRWCGRRRSELTRPLLAGAVAALLAVAAIRVFFIVSYYVSPPTAAAVSTTSELLSVETLLLYGLLVVTATVPVPLVLRAFCRPVRNELEAPDRTEASARDHWDALGSVFGDEDVESVSKSRRRRESSEEPETATPASRNGTEFGRSSPAYESECTEEDLRRNLSGGSTIGCAMTVGSVLFAVELNWLIDFSTWFGLVLLVTLNLGYLIVAGLMFVEARRAWIRLQELVYQRDVGESP